MTDQEAIRFARREACRDVLEDERVDLEAEIDAWTTRCHALENERDSWRDGYFAAKKHWEDAEAENARLKADAGGYLMQRLTSAEAEAARLTRERDAARAAAAGLQAWRGKALAAIADLGSTRGGLEVATGMFEQMRDERDRLTVRCGALETLVREWFDWSERDTDNIERAYFLHDRSRAALAAGTGESGDA